MHSRPEPEPDRVDRTQDGRWQVFYKGQPNRGPFVKQKLAFAHLKVCLRDGEGAADPPRRTPPSSGLGGEGPG
jgi:hypothetical protein